jgi:hypothetical protein
MGELCTSKVAELMDERIIVGSKDTVSFLVRCVLILDLNRLSLHHIRVPKISNSLTNSLTNCGLLYSKCWQIQ